MTLHDLEHYTRNTHHLMLVNTLRPSPIEGPSTWYDYDEDGKHIVHPMKIEFDVYYISHVEGLIRLEEYRKIKVLYSYRNEANGEVLQIATTAPDGSFRKYNYPTFEAIERVLKASCSKGDDE